MSTPRIQLGMFGKGLKRRHLESLGYNILAANVRFTSGEIAWPRNTARPLCLWRYEPEGARGSARQRSLQYPGSAPR